MIKYEDLYDEVKRNLSEYRFKHTEGVVKRAVEYAKIYGQDEEIVKITAIAHDIAKELSEEEIKKYINDYKIQLDEIERNNKHLLHSKIGAHICKDKYGFTEDMVNSVEYHTTGRPNMSILEKIIFLADSTEENRKYDYLNYVEIIKNDINKGMVEITKWMINNLLERKEIIHPNTISCYNYYIKLT